MTLQQEVLEMVTIYMQTTLNKKLQMIECNLDGITDPVGLPAICFSDSLLIPRLPFFTQQKTNLKILKKNTTDDCFYKRNYNVNLPG